MTTNKEKNNGTPLPRPPSLPTPIAYAEAQMWLINLGEREKEYVRVLIEREKALAQGMGLGSIYI